MAKSFFFQNFDPADKDNALFLEDLRKLVDASDAWPSLLASVGTYVRASSTPEKRAVVEAVAQASHVPAIMVAYHMRCVETLLAAFSENAEELPDQLAADFIERGGIPADRIGALTNLLVLIQQQFAKDSDLIDEADARNGVLPRLELARTTSELRGVFRRTSDGSEQLRSFVGMISVQLAFDAGVEAFFQCDRGLAEYLIGELKTALDKLAQMEERQALYVAPPALKDSRSA